MSDKIGDSAAMRITALEGMRALAVTAVLFYHLGAPWLPGGFLGVDVFFVLSGFLITRILLGELHERGRVDLVGFWLRRARRLLPALFVLIAVISVYIATRPPEQKTPLRDDLISSLLYVANWQFVLEGRSYFSEFQSPSPLRHLWSLAIEEQFYLVFPILAPIAFAGINRSTIRGKAFTFSICSVVFCASIAVMALLYDEADPSRAYYGTDARIHELIAGVGLSIIMRIGAVGPASAASSLATGGFFALLVLFVAIDDRGPFYYYGGSVVVCAATVALIAGLTLAPRAGLVRWLLSGRVAVNLGKISYSLYLWHWPVIAVLTPESIGVSGLTLAALRVSVALILSVLSYHIVEKPIRNGSVAGLRLTAVRVFPASIAAVLLLSVTTVIVTLDAKPEPDYVKQSEGLIVPRDADPRLPVIGLVGDSVAASLQRALAEEAGRRAHTLVSAARPGCGVGSSLLLDETDHPFPIAAVCAERTPRLQEQLIGRYRPEVVLWHSARDRTDIRVDGRVLRAGSAAWVRHRFADWDAALQRLTGQGARLVLLLPVWSSNASAGSSCGGEFNFDPAVCGRTFVTTEHLRRLYMDWAKGRSEPVTVVDLSKMMCPTGFPCPRTTAGVRMRDDDVHFSGEGSRLLAPRIIEAALNGASE